MKRRLSQVFLKDKNIIGKIIQSAEIKQDETILEIGAGQGSITFPMLERGAFLLIFEPDKYYRKFLTERLKNLGLYQRCIIDKDFLKFNPAQYEKNDKKIKIVSNIPYHITGKILRHIIKYNEYYGNIFIMVQKEVADRLVSERNTKQFGALTVLIQTFFRAKQLFLIKPVCFYPVPKVYSSFVHLEPLHHSMDTKKLNLLEDIVKSAFQQRRKKLKSTLFKDFPELYDAKFADMRPGELAVNDYVKLLEKEVKFESTAQRV